MRVEANAWLPSMLVQSYLAALHVLSCMRSCDTSDTVTAFATLACPHVKDKVPGRSMQRRSPPTHWHELDQQTQPGYNDAEYLVDLITKSDRQGKGAEIADYYCSPALYQVCCLRRAPGSG